MTYFFPRKKFRIHYNMKTVWATFWPIFFTNTSGHPGRRQKERKKERKKESCSDSKDTLGAGFLLLKFLTGTKITNFAVPYLLYSTEGGIATRLGCVTVRRTPATVP
jgi:hypothetical protein